MMSDLDERERAAFAPDPTTKAREEEERITRKLKEEITRIRATHANNLVSATAPIKKKTKAAEKESTNGGGRGLDKEKILKVSWETIGEDYTAQRLWEIFEKFGKVDDVMKSSKNRGSALVVMESKDATVAALGNVFDDLSNPLLIVPLQPSLDTAFTSSQMPVEPDGSILNNLVGARYQAFENSVLEKIKKAARNRNEK